MVRLTLIARVSDGLPLAEGLDSDKDGEIDQYKTQAKVSNTWFSFSRTTVGLRSGDHSMWLSMHASVIIEEDCLVADYSQIRSGLWRC